MASTYLTRTNSSPTNAKKYTWSSWNKIDSSGWYPFFSPTTDGGHSYIGFSASGDGFGAIEHGDSAGTRYYVATNAAQRDSTGWYHVVVQFDSTQSTASDRVKLYINNELQTSLAESTYPSQNLDSWLNTNGNTIEIGRRSQGSGTYYSGLISHAHFIDGTVYDASAFGEYDANGVWKIILEPSVTYGTNGFFILKDGNSVTDQSGNSNNFTVAGGTLTNTEDSPSNVFNVLNAVSNPPNGYTLSNGNTRATQTGSSFQRFYIANTIAPTSGKWYWESKLITSGGSDRTSIGICSYDENIGTGTTEPNNELSIVTGISRIRIRENGSTTEVDSFYTVPSANDIFMYALDLDNTKFYFGVNGNWWNYNTAETGGDPTSGSGYVTNSTNIIKNAMSAFLRIDAGAVSTTFTNEFNFGNGYFGTTAVSSAGTNASGNGIFEYDVPSGYTALSTRGLNL